MPLPKSRSHNLSLTQWQLALAADSGVGVWIGGRGITPSMTADLGPHPSPTTQRLGIQRFLGIPAFLGIQEAVFPPAQHSKA